MNSIIQTNSQALQLLYDTHTEKIHAKQATLFWQFHYYKQFLTSCKFYINCTWSLGSEVICSWQTVITHSVPLPWIQSLSNMSMWSSQLIKAEKGRCYGLTSLSLFTNFKIKNSTISCFIWQKSSKTEINAYYACNVKRLCIFQSWNLGLTCNTILNTNQQRVYCDIRKHLQWIMGRMWVKFVGMQ
jgi:hypothetical protein